MKGFTKKAVAAAAAVCVVAGLIPVGISMKQRTGGVSRAEEVPQVEFSKESGTYADAFDLTLSYADKDAVIYYTLDGSDPSDPDNAGRTEYASGISIKDRKGDANVLSAIDPILFDAVNVEPNEDGTDFVSTIKPPSDDAVDKCTVVKAVAEDSTGNYTDVVSGTYFIGDMSEHLDGIKDSVKAAGKDLAVMSISMDADDLFDSEKGIYVKGDIYQKDLEEYLENDGELWSAEDCRARDANYKQKGKEWERAAHIDYFESDGTKTELELQQDCGIRIQGNYSRSDYQKSFRLYARADYGEKNFKYAFWDDSKDDNGEVIGKYKKIVLRNGGNCAFTTKFSDAYWQSLMEDIDCDTLNARPCAVYLNGEYWGLYILQDDFCDNFFEDKHGVNKDDVLVYKGDAEKYYLGYKLDEGELPEGTEDEDYYFQDIEKFMKEHDDLSSQEDYDAFAAMIDPDSALDFFATEVWINNKWDWPGKNWSMWKTKETDPDNPYADGRWRYLIYDVEFGGVSGSSDTTENTVKNSKLLTTGTNEADSENRDKPNVRIFALFMTNPDFRARFYQRLEGFSTGMFEKERLLERADQFKDIYEPILPQFFDRFPTNSGSVKSAINGGYASWQCIVDFIKGKKKSRAEYIPTITSWIKKQAGDPDTPAALPEDTAAAPVPEGNADAGAAGTAPAPGENTAAVPASGASVTESDTIKKSVTKKKLSDGAVKITTKDENGKVVSVKYQVESTLYELKSDKTFSYLSDAANKKAVKKLKVLTVKDTVKAGGKKYKVTEIQAGAFQGMTKLTKVTVGKNVTVIGKNAWKGCKNLKQVQIKSAVLKKIGNQAFGGISASAVFSVPSQKVKAYQKLLTAKTGFKKKAMSVRSA